MLALLLTPAQESNASMASIAILAIIVVVGTTYALVLVVVPIISAFNATRDYLQMRQIHLAIATRDSSITGSGTTPSPGTCATRQVHNTPSALDGPSPTD